MSTEKYWECEKFQLFIALYEEIRSLVSHTDDVSLALFLTGIFLFIHALRLNDDAHQNVKGKLLVAIKMNFFQFARSFSLFRARFAPRGDRR
jgi:hypothetical protein